MILVRNECALTRVHWPWISVTAYSAARESFRSFPEDLQSEFFLPPSRIRTQTRREFQAQLSPLQIMCVRPYNISIFSLFVAAFVSPEFCRMLRILFRYRYSSHRRQQETQGRGATPP